MPPKPSAKWNRPKYWRLRGTASDGLTVTLGSYETIEEADADMKKLKLEGGYRDLVVQPLTPKPPPETSVQ